MKKPRLYYILPAVFVAGALAIFHSAREPDDINKKETTDEPSLLPWHHSVTNLELPFFHTGEEKLVSHSGFTLLYDELHEQAQWVAYLLTRVRTIKQFDRTDRFLPDPKVSTGSAENHDYTRSGFDRGHLAPAADMAWSEASMAESFYFSNISPQLPSFNRGVWKRLEEQVRKWAETFDSLYVVTGPVLEGSLPVIGPNQVSVPNYYYKVLLNYNYGQLKGIGFIMPNRSSDRNISHYAVTIDSVQKLTGIDFFYQLPDAIEEVVEKSLCLECWFSLN